MSREQLALETQLLLQEVTQVGQFEAAPASTSTSGPQEQEASAQAAVSTDEAAIAIATEAALGVPMVSEYERAKQALVDKLKRRKDEQRQRQEQINLARYGVAGAAGAASATSSPAPNAARLTPLKQKQITAKLPVVHAGMAASKKKKDLLTKLRTQAIRQGAQETAKMFGYSSYQQQLKALNQIDKKLLQRDAQAKAAEEAATGLHVDDDADADADAAEDEHDQDSAEDMDVDGEMGDHAANEHAQMEPMEEDGMASPSEATQPVSSNPSNALSQVGASHGNVEKASESARLSDVPTAMTPGSMRKRRVKRIDVIDEEDDGNEADSEQDGVDEAEDADASMEEVEYAPVAAEPAAPKPNKDKAASFRRLLEAERLQTKTRKRLRKAAEFVESEAEEEEEEDVLQIGGLGDFGFGVPQAVTQASAEAEEEKNALKMREDDLEGIVDELSDDEREHEQDLDEIFRREQEEQDREHVKEVMRNVKEGFGRNRRAFSSSIGNGAEARGRFNLNDLVAADGDKLEAARLGLLESDEDLSDNDGDADKSKEKDEEDAEEDEEAEMERMLRDRFLNQPKIYITSSESESDNEEEMAKTKGADDDSAEAESDEERERQQIKAFSERARINRRMHRMKELQRQMSAEQQEATPTPAVVPGLLFEDDDEEDSQELLKVLGRTEEARLSQQSSSSQGAPQKQARGNRFSSFGVTSKSRASASFTRVANQCTLFDAGSNASSSKGFVFTSFSSDRADEGAVDDHAPAPDHAAPLTKSISCPTRGEKRPLPDPLHASAAASSKKTKPKPSSDFFSVLASYRCVSTNAASR